MKHSAALFTVFLAVLIDLLGFGIILPLLPYFASKFQASALTIGLLYSVYSFAQLIFSPLWGSFSDRIGRRPIMLLSTLGATFSYLLFAWSNSLWLLFISRIIAGVMGGNISTAQAYVADVTTEEDRAKGMGLIGAAFGIGFVIGPAIAALVIHPQFLSTLGIEESHKYAIPGYFAAGLSLISFLLVFFKLPETVDASSTSRDKISRTSIFTASFWKTVFKKQASGLPYLFALLIGCAFLFSFSQSSLYSAFPLFCKSQLGLAPEQVGWLFAAMGLIAVVVQGGLIRILVKRFQESLLFLIGCFFMVIGFALIPFCASGTQLLGALAVMSIGGSLNGPTLNSLISKEADPSQIGATMGTSQGIMALGRVLGPAWGGFLYGFAYFLPFEITASILALSLLVGWQLQAQVLSKKADRK